MPKPASLRFTILIVDNDQTMCDICSDILSDVYGPVVICAYGTKEAVEKFMLHQQTVELLFAAIDRPIIDGLSLFKQLRQIKPSLKVIFTSSRESDPILKEVTEHGPLLRKPFYRKSLLEIVKRALPL